MSRRFHLVSRADNVTTDSEFTRGPHRLSVYHDSITRAAVEVRRFHDVTEIRAFVADFDRTLEAKNTATNQMLDDREAGVPGLQWVMADVVSHLERVRAPA